MLPIENGRKWELLSSFEYFIEDTMDGESIIVPAGFVTDFASIPQIFWSILPPTGPWSKAACLHDYLYTIGGKYQYCINDLGVPCYHLYSKKQTDDMFRDTMKLLGVPAFERNVMWLAVRSFGRGNFGKV